MRVALSLLLSLAGLAMGNAAGLVGSAAAAAKRNEAEDDDALLEEELEEVVMSVHDLGEEDFMDQMQEYLEEDLQEEAGRELRRLAECGNSGSSCCGSNTLYGDGYCYDENYFTCNGGTCQACGDINQRCCHTVDGPTCDNEYAYCDVATDTCQECGDHDEPCCPNLTSNMKPCKDSGYRTCDDVNFSPPLCRSCGGEGQICCTDPGAIKECDSAHTSCDHLTNTCVSCGGGGERCCPNPLGETGPGLGRCDDDYKRSCVDDGFGSGICKGCGNNGEPCCKGPGGVGRCDSSHSHCTASGMCESCGGNNEPCCPDPFDSNQSTAPGSGTCDNNDYRTCVDDGNGGGICKSCGDQDPEQPCCIHPLYGETCDSFHATCVNHVCKYCGRAGEPCCDGNRCDNQGYRTCNVNHPDGPTCEHCGANGELPCAGDNIKSCDSEFSMVDSSTELCTACGGTDQPCCNSNNECRDSSDRICMTDVSGSTCQDCGNLDQPCCDTVSGVKECNKSIWLVCNATAGSVCHSCGGIGELCCPDGSCENPSSVGCEPSTGTCMELHLHPSETPSQPPSNTPSSEPTAQPTISPAPSAYPSLTPSATPSDRPTTRPTLSLAPTATETSPAPTLLHTDSCPPAGGAEQTVPASVLTMSKSAPGTLCMLRLVDGDKRVPVARSYNGNEWEQYSGAYSHLSVSCTGSSCTFKLDEPEAGEFQLMTTTGYNVTDQEAAARFFESSTFGMDTSAVSSLASGIGSSGVDAIATWVETQMDTTATPMTSHRVFYRKRLNGVFLGSHYGGQVTQPCELHTMYRQYAFTEKDYKKDVELVAVSATQTKLLIDGAVVTVVDGDVATKSGNVYDVGGSYELCYRPKHFVGGRMRLRHPSDGCHDAYFDGVYGNPPVNVGPVSTEAGMNIVELDSSEAQPIDVSLHPDGTQMISIIGPLDDTATCATFVDGPGPVPTAHALFNNTWFIHTPRFKMLEHTDTSPIADGGASVVAATSGDEYKYLAKCSNVVRNFLNEESCILADSPDACGKETYTSPEKTLVCGGMSTEVANDLTLGGTQGYGAFDARANYGGTASSTDLRNQKEYAWGGAVLTAIDQLRQRVAWALSQIIVINRLEVGDTWTEQHLVFYDIFVRHAFGNYRDILREVSYSGMMSNFLSYHESKSTAYHWKEGDIHRHPDENYAREVMQLFSIGLHLLNSDGTIIDAKEGGGRTYTNDDIVEYSRVWTGFDTEDRRGNLEDSGMSTNRIDPLQIRPAWRDVFPKMGLRGQYVGDSYPLCADLPAQHFLKSGARYRLLGGTSYPELQEEQDRAEWIDDPNALKMRAESGGGLNAALACAGSGCKYQAEVVLPNDVACHGRECFVDTVRTIEVGDTGIFYEYIRPPCANLALYNDAKKIKMRNGSSRTYMCSDPRTEEAGSICCNPSNNRAYRYEEYWAEHVRFSTVESRCDAIDDREMCENCSVWDCSGTSCYGYPYYWTTESCDVKIKIDADNRIALVHHAPTETSAPVTKHVDEDTKTFFRVHWQDAEPVSRLLQQCGAANLPCSVTSDGYCMCSVNVIEEQAFMSAPTYDEVSSLTIGAFPPSPGTPKTHLGDGLYVYGNTYTVDTVFEYTDEQGFLQLRKNMVAKSQIIGTTPTLEFRTPVHMISLAEENERDAHYETEAALDHYFRHPNTAPFLAYRLAQRMVTANPTPRFVAAIATAFRTGTYTYVNGGTTKTYGSGKYGDLAAATAAVLLDSEARDVLLEADPYHGLFKEPLMKLFQFMRSLEFQAAGEAPIPKFVPLENVFRQMVFEAPDVFSFFPFDFSPDGLISTTSLVAPVASVLNTPEIINTVNGFETFVKYGLLSCYQSFGYTLTGKSSSCSSRVPGLTQPGSSGHVTYHPASTLSSSQVVADLNTIMTSGRLSASSLEIIKQAYNDEMLATSSHERATIRAQQLILTTPEFHSTGRVEPDATNDGNRTAPSPPSPTGNSYKAVVFLMLAGGCDSYNMIVPHTCANYNLTEQYLDERESLALTSSERDDLVINVTGQPCEKFSLHPELLTLYDMYNAGDLAFFMNTGVLNDKTDETNYRGVTRTQLFSHKDMQHEAKRGDPFDVKLRTGYLGRLADALALNGYQPNALSIDVSSVAVQGTTNVTVSPTVVNREGVKQFHPRPDNEADIKDDALELNKQHLLSSSSMLGETWSARFTKALWEIDILEDFLSDVSLTTYADDVVDEKLAKKFEMTTKLMLTRDKRGADRDVFYVSMGGFDHHDDMKEKLKDRFQELDPSVDWFRTELQAQGLWDNVTIVAVSDFGRTITPNSGEGSDHAWGGNYWIAGGAVKGKQALCDYPTDVSENSPLNVGRGRLIPTCSWEAIWHGVTQWMFDGAVSDEDLYHILPNAQRTGSILYNLTDMYE